VPQQIIPADQACAIRRRKGITITFVNQSTIDVYVDDEPARLNQSAVGAVPSGTKIINGGGELQVSQFKGIIWARAATQTTLEVQP